MYNIIIADDHSMSLLGLETFLKDLNYNVVGRFENGIACLNGIQTLRPDLVIMDISMPGMSGLEVLSQIRSKHIFVKVILMTMHREISVYLKSKELGCDAYVLKDFAIDELKYAISEVLQGKNYLSPKLEELLIMDSNKNNSDLLEILSKSEFKIIELVADFKTNKEIASFLFISEKTVEAHKRNIAEKLNLPKGKNILLHWALENFKK